MRIWRWLKGENNSPQGCVAGLPHAVLEQLEPRLLLSATSLDPQLFDQAHDLSEGQVISVDINSSSESYLISESAVRSQDVQVSENTDQSQPAPLAQAKVIPAGTELGVQEQSYLANTNVVVNEVETYSSDSNGATPEDEGDAPVSIDSVNLGQTGTESIRIRGPPQGESSVFDTNSAVCDNKAEELTSQQEEVEASSILVLPGLELVDTDTSLWAGQVIYLDFDGAEGVVYDGPVTVGPFDVPAFQAPAGIEGQQQVIISEVLTELEHVFAGTGVIFITQQPLRGIAYSTIYIGGDDFAFSDYGSFLGLAEQVDVGGLDASDEGLVFSENLASGWVQGYAKDLAGVIAHEAGHLLVLHYS